MDKPISVTVFIPVYNGMKDHLPETFHAVMSQTTDKGFELLIIDSGSSDGSVEFLLKQAKINDNVRVVQIQNSEFSHGGTRQKAAEIAKGEFIVYLSQDAIPANDKWLDNMITPLEMSENIGGVLGKQIPRYDCFPHQKYDIQNVFSSQGVDGAITVWGAQSGNTFYSDVCSATRRDLLLNEVPYQNVSYAEDQRFATDFMAKGFDKAYTSLGAVIHSNDIRLRKYKMRIFDEFMGLRECGSIELSKPKLCFMIRNIISRSRRDFVRIIRDDEYSPKRKLYFIVVNPLYIIQRWRGVCLAAKAELGDKKHSLEVMKKKM